MCDLRPTEKDESRTENDIALGRKSTLWQVRPRPIFQSHLVFRLCTACYCIDWCIDLKQPATV